MGFHSLHRCNTFVYNSRNFTYCSAKSFRVRIICSFFFSCTTESHYFCFLLLNYTYIVWNLQLHVPGCAYLTADGIVRAIKRLQEQKGNLKSLHIRGISNITKEHFDILKLMFQNNVEEGLMSTKYSHWRSLTLNRQDDRPMDVDICPKCRDVRMVFNCTRENCRLVCLDYCIIFSVSNA